MANYEATRYDWDGQYLTGVEGVNTGIVIPWSSVSIPSGFLECNGQAVSRSTYAALFAVISTTYGIGDGTTTFNVPDLTDRTVVNKSNTKNLAQTDGANTVTRSGNVGGSSGDTTLQTAQIPSHIHTNAGAMAKRNQMFSDQQGTNISPSAQNSQNTGSGQAHSHNITGTYTGGADSVLQPYLVVVYIIKH